VKRSIGRHAWLLLAIVLVAAQALGLMHRIVHGPQVPAGYEAVAGGHAQDSTDHHHGHGHGHGHDHDHDHGSGSGWIAQLFSGHGDDSTCRLFDPLNHDALPAVPVLALPMVLAPLVFLLLQGGFVARWSALFDARGPPALR
jgi:hypothetical protein